MAYKKYIVLFCCSVMALCLLGQNSKVSDSLKTVLGNTSSPIEKVNILLALSDSHINTDINKSLMYAEEAFNLSEKSSNKEGKLRSSLALAEKYYFLSDLNKAMEYANISKNLSEELKLSDYLANSYDAIGTIYYEIGNQAKSTENFYASLKIYEELKDKEGLGGTFCRIGTLYLDQKDYDKAVEYYTKSINLAKEIKNESGIASNLNNLGKVYSDQKQYEKALKSYQEALAINIRTKIWYLAGSNYLNIAEVYVKRGNYTTALINVKNARQIFEKLGNKLRLAKSQVVLSEIYLATGQFSQSEAVALSALKIGERENYKDIIVSAAGALNKLYLHNKDSLMAFRYFILQKQYQDSLFLDAKQKTLSKLELKYQFETNEQLAKTVRQRKNIAIAVISGCLFFCLIIIVLILKQLRLRAKKMELEKASHEQELEFKNKEMVLNVMSLMKKNELLADLSEKLIHIEEESTSPESKSTIKKVARELQKSQEDEIWKEFSHRFKEVHGEFYNTLLLKFPTLTPNELKLCAFLRLNMSSKDIAELTGQRVSTLETARYRLRQKLGIANSEVNLITFLSSI